MLGAYSIDPSARQPVNRGGMLPASSHRRPTYGAACMAMYTLTEHRLSRSHSPARWRTSARGAESFDLYIR